MWGAATYYPSQLARIDIDGVMFIAGTVSIEPAFSLSDLRRVHRRRPLKIRFRDLRSFDTYPGPRLTHTPRYEPVF